MIFLAFGILIFALAPSYWLVLVGALIVGLCVVSARTTLAAMTQALVPDVQRGRVESAMVTVIGIGTMGSLILAGLLADVLGPESVGCGRGLHFRSPGSGGTVTRQPQWPGPIIVGVAPRLDAGEKGRWEQRVPRCARSIRQRRRH